MDHSLGRHGEFSVDVAAFKITSVEPDSLDTSPVTPRVNVLMIRQRIAP